MSKRLPFYRRFPSTIVSFVWNILIVYMLYMLCRVVYVWEFWDMYAAGWGRLSVARLLEGALRFDTSAILYTNCLYAAMVLLPMPRRWTSCRGYRMAAKVLYVGVNAVMIVANLVDTVYSRYTGRRTTWTFFAEFSHEGNLGGIVGVELLNHWYLVLVGLLMVAALVLLYAPMRPSRRPAAYYLSRSLAVALYVPLSIAGMRGGATTAVRPITLSNANQYVNRPAEAAIVLNTPFTLLRTIGKPSFADPAYLPQEEMEALYTPVHNVGVESGAGHEVLRDTVDRRQNVVVLIVESLAAEYIGAYNEYEGYTPFLDSLIGQSLTFAQSFANGRKSIDAMPSILSGIPMFVEPFVLTPYSLNAVGGMAGELGREGYATAFFHGAENGSMGFQAYARATGFQQYYGRTEYNADGRFGGDDDFDGTWAIWDEPFLQYYALTLSTLPQPFMSAVFTASSHHPFRIPAQYEETLHTDGHPMYACIRYTDMALRRFFETARRQPWYANTLFVITADHTNHSERPSYRDPLGPYRVPIVIYDPRGRLPRGRLESVAQQTDIMPTVLTLLGCAHPYVAFGKDLLHTPPDSTWALHYNNGVYQYVRQGYLLLFDGAEATALYRIGDTSRANRLALPEEQERKRRYTRHVEAIVQSYMQRMIGDSLTVR